jgi:hypothetical protein
METTDHRKYIRFMSTVAEIKAAAAELNIDDQFELLQWLAHSDALRQRQVEALKKELQLGVNDINAGRYKTYNDESLPRLAEEIAQRGRAELAKRKAS